jgi:hypothetical protein
LERGVAVRSDALSPRMMRIIADLAGDWHRLDARIESLSTEIAALADQEPACERVMTIISSAMVAAIGKGSVSSRSHPSDTLPKMSIHL